MKQRTEPVISGCTPPDPGEYPCRQCDAPSTRIGGFCSRECEKCWRDGVPKCPGPDCLMCNGAACKRCGGSRSVNVFGDEKGGSVSSAPCPECSPPVNSGRRGRP